MKIKVDNFYINADSQGNVFITEEVMGAKTGKPTEVRVSGYASTFKSALIDMYRRRCYGADVGTLEDAINVLQDKFDECVKLLEVKENQNES